MQVGDLVEKVKGYNHKDTNLFGIVIAITVERSLKDLARGLGNGWTDSSGFCKKVKVWSCDGEIESWLMSFCEVISESR